jgi:hypothetical protein
MLRLDDPNAPQPVSLAWIEPNDQNVRLFVEKVSLRDLEDIYRRALREPATILPDAPIVRWMGLRSDGTPKLVLLAGERRVTAARNVKYKRLACRVVSGIKDEEAYKFILQHNTVAGITTVELAYRAAEMARLGFTDDEISRELGGVATYRYRAVGELVDADQFTDAEKLCDPSIIEWFEASKYGQAHFALCFFHWNAGDWDAEECSRNFRKRGRQLPLDNAEKGFRVTFHGNRLVVRGQCDLDVMENDTAWDMLRELELHIQDAKERLDAGDTFGHRTVHLINPNTVGQ